MKKYIALCMATLLFILSGCGAVPDKQDIALPPVRQAPTAEVRAEEMVAEMTVAEMLYQMFFVTPEAITGVGRVVAAGEGTKNALAAYPVGGLIYFAQNFKSREQTAEMLKNAQSYAKIPLFFGVDEEGGKVARLGSNPAMGVTKHPPMQQIGKSGDVTKAYAVGETLAKDLSALGFNVDFAPDADVLIYTENLEIGDRSFGTDPELVSVMVSNVVKGMEENGVSATLKHFPGHGSTYTNSHNGYAESKRTIDELRSAELLPFQSGIAAGADFIMVSHMTLINAAKEKVPCSVSREVITDLLKEELGYKGIVITDALNMGAVTEMYSAGAAAVKAVQAGTDMLLMPADFKAAHAALLQAVESGEVPQSRIEESVRKILQLKMEKGLL